MLIDEQVEQTVTSETPEHEAYMTPSWVIRRLLEVWQPYGGMDLEPAVGEGAIVKALHQLAPNRIWSWTTCDIRDVPAVTMNCEPGHHVSVFHRQGDYLRPNDLPSLHAPMMAKTSLVITNPPFSLADQFILQSRRLCPVAELVFLLRLGFLSSKDRMPLWKEVGEPDLWILPNRPSYKTSKPGRLDTDKYDYAWFIWPKGGFRARGRIGHLAETSLEERKRG